MSKVSAKEQLKYLREHNLYLPEIEYFKIYTGDHTNELVGSTLVDTLGPEYEFYVGKYDDLYAYKVDYFYNEKIIKRTRGYERIEASSPWENTYPKYPRKNEFKSYGKEAMSEELFDSLSEDIREKILADMNVTEEQIVTYFENKMHPIQRKVIEQPQESKQVESSEVTNSDLVDYAKIVREYQEMLGNNQEDTNSKGSR